MVKSRNRKKELERESSEGLLKNIHMDTRSNKIVRDAKEQELKLGRIKTLTGLALQLSQHEAGN